VRLLSLVGQDDAGILTHQILNHLGLPSHFVPRALPQTCHSTILYDPEGRRMIFTDLKEIQQQDYPPPLFEEAIVGCELAVLCNINYSRRFLPRVKNAGIPLASDVHAIASLDDDYNRDFMAAADILFMSHERLPAAPEQFARQVMARYQSRILVIGLGAEGALLAVREEKRVKLEQMPAQTLRPVINTVGAGDALFSAFLHSYSQDSDPRLALQKAILFAGYKIGSSGAATGFLQAPALETFYRQIHIGKTYASLAAAKEAGQLTACSSIHHGVPLIL